MSGSNPFFGVMNTERNVMVNGYNGRGVFTTAEEAKELKAEMGGQYDSHLRVVKMSEFNY